jgi:polar amino acid transport system substrate-binding protein
MILPLSFLLVLLAGFSCPPEAFPQVIEVVTEELPPFQILKNGQVGGFATEIVQAAFERAELSYTISVYPWARAYNIALAKGSTCIYSIVRSPEREDKFKWAAVIARVYATLFAYKKNSRLPPSTIEEAKGHTLVTVRDDVTHQFLLKKGFTPGTNLFVVNTSKEAFRAISSFSDVSLTILDNLTFPYRALDAGVSPDDLVPVFDIADLSLEEWVAFSKDTPDDIVARFTEAFNSLKIDGTIAKIKKGWNVRE